MSSHRETCISRLAELADEPQLRAAVILQLATQLDTRILSLAVQHVLELRDSIADAQGTGSKWDNGRWLPPSI